MSPPRRTAEPPEAPTEEPTAKEAPDEEQVRGWVREEIKSALDELLHPGPEEAGIPEKKLEEPEVPQTNREIENAAEKIVRAAQALLKPPEKDKDDGKAEPERPPQPENRLRSWLWGKE